MKKSLIKTQKKILFLVKNFFLNEKFVLKKDGYFAFYSNSKGNNYIKKKIYKIKTNKIKNIFLDTLDIFSNANLKIVSNLQFNRFYKDIIITWGNQRSFLTNGVFYDKYLSTYSSDHPNSYWIIIADKKIKTRIDNNIAIIYPYKNVFILYKFIKILSLNFIYYISGLDNKLIDKDLLISNSINNFINKKLNFLKYKNLIMPYEGQIFQKRIFIDQKNKNKKLKTYGFDHSAPHSLATNLFYSLGSPEKLLVSGLSTKNTYSKFYNWPKKKILVTYPSRYKKFNKNKFQNKMFLPYDTKNSEEILKNIEYFLKNKKDKSLKRFHVKIHPEKINDRKHIILKEKINKITNRYKKKFSQKSKNALTIAVGFTTTPIVALEFKLSVLHICPNPDFDIYLDFFWPNIILKKINKYIYLYNFTKFGTYLDFKNKDRILEIIND